MVVSFDIQGNLLIVLGDLLWCSSIPLYNMKRVTLCLSWFSNWKHATVAFAPHKTAVE